MKVCRTIRYRLHPGTVRKNQQLHGTAGACRFVWNHMVGKLKDEYEAWGACNFYFMSTKTIPTPGLGRTFTILRRYSYPWLQDYSAYIVKSSLQPIETTYREFFKDQENGGQLDRKPPRFHGKHATAPSFPINYQSAKVSRNSLYVQKIGWMKMVGNNPYSDGEFKSGQIKYECGNWYAYLVYEVEAQTSLPHAIREVGIDRNIAEGRLAVLSDGVKHGGPDLVKKVARRKRYQRKMARQVRGSNRRKITRIRLQKAYQAERFARLNWAHHVSKDISRKYDIAYMEALNIRGMTNSAKGTKEKPGKHVKAKSELNRKILISAWGVLENCLNYKMEIRKVHPAYTSQMCHSCGHIAKENRSSQPEFKCTACGHADDADVNAALNILAFGNGAAGRGGGDTGGVSRQSRPVKRQQIGKLGRKMSANFSL